MKCDKCGKKVTTKNVTVIRDEFFCSECKSILIKKAGEKAFLRCLERMAQNMILAKLEK